MKKVCTLFVLCILLTFVQQIITFSNDKIGQTNKEFVLRNQVQSTKREFFGLLLVPYVICFFASTGIWPRFPQSLQGSVNEMGQLIFAQSDEQIRDFCSGKFSFISQHSLLFKGIIFPSSNQHTSSTPTTPKTIITAEPETPTETEKPDEPNTTAEIERLDERGETFEREKPDKLNKNGEVEKPGDLEEPDELEELYELEELDELDKPDGLQKPDELGELYEVKNPNELKETEELKQPEEMENPDPGELDNPDPDELENSYETEEHANSSNENAATAEYTIGMNTTIGKMINMKIEFKNLISDILLSFLNVNKSKP